MSSSLSSTQELGLGLGVALPLAAILCLAAWCACRMSARARVARAVFDGDASAVSLDVSGAARGNGGEADASLSLGHSVAASSIGDADHSRLSDIDAALVEPADGSEDGHELEFGHDDEGGGGVVKEERGRRECRGGPVLVPVLLPASAPGPRREPSPVKRREPQLQLPN